MRECDDGKRNVGENGAGVGRCTWVSFVMAR